MLGSIEVRLSITCDACDSGIPINGPVPIVKCVRCMELTRLEGRVGWVALLAPSLTRAVRADRPADEERRETAQLRMTSRTTWPPCGACGQPFEARRVKLAMLKKAPITCACGASLALQPVPAHFAAVFPYVRGFVDADVFDETPGPAAASQAAPVVMACMSCAAPLPVDGAHRLVECEHCKAKNYLPDDLWLSLHPAPKREAWFVVYDEDELLTSLGR
jgi:hypothetical protein